jgi:MFS family permease
MISETVRSPAVTLLCAAQFVVVLDGTIVAVALPSIGQDLGFSETTLPWVISAFALVFGGFLMLLGRVADVVGPRRVLIAGFAIFGAASLICGLAQAPWQLVAGRALQGLGAAAVSPAALALLTAMVPVGPARTRALGLWTAAAAGGGALGWVLGGLIAAGPGWPWVFLVNVAPCALAIVLAFRLLPGGGSRGTRGPLDVAGAVAATGGLALLVLGLTRAEQSSPGVPTRWRSPWCCWPPSRGSSGAPPTRSCRRGRCASHGSPAACWRRWPSRPRAPGRCSPACSGSRATVGWALRRPACSTPPSTSR